MRRDAIELLDVLDAERGDGRYSSRQPSASWCFLLREGTTARHEAVMTYAEDRHVAGARAEPEIMQQPFAHGNQQGVVNLHDIAAALADEVMMQSIADQLEATRPSTEVGLRDEPY